MQLLGVTGSFPDTSKGTGSNTVTGSYWLFLGSYGRLLDGSCGYWAVTDGYWWLQGGCWRYWAVTGSCWTVTGGHRAVTGGIGGYWQFLAVTVQLLCGC